MLAAAALSARLLVAEPRSIERRPAQPVNRVPVYPGWWVRRLADMAAADELYTATQPERRRSRHSGRSFSDYSATGRRKNGRLARAGALLGAFSLSGCAMSMPVPDTLCQLPRPAARLNDTHVTRTAARRAARVWDRQCTVLGWVS